MTMACYTQSSAAEVGVNDTIKGVIDNPYDRDYYTFTISSPIITGLTTKVGDYTFGIIKADSSTSIYKISQKEDLYQFDAERKTTDLRSMHDVLDYEIKQVDNVEISEEGMRALREKLKEIKPEVEEPIGYELTIQDTNEVEWEHYTVYNIGGKILAITGISNSGYTSY